MLQSLFLRVCRGGTKLCDIAVEEKSFMLVNLAISYECLYGNSTKGEDVGKFMNVWYLLKVWWWTDKYYMKLRSSSIEMNLNCLLTIIEICFSWHAVSACSHLFLVFENRTRSLTLWKSERTLESVSAGVWPKFISRTLPPLASSLANIFKAEVVKTWLYRNLPVCTVLEESSYIISYFFLQINAQNSHFCGVFVLNPCKSYYVSSSNSQGTCVVTKL